MEMICITDSLAVSTKIRINRNQMDVLLTLLLFSIEFNVPVMGFFTMRKLGLAVLLILYGLYCRSAGLKTDKNTAFLSVFCIGLFFYASWIVEQSGAKDYAAQGVYSENNMLVLLLYAVIFPMMLMPLFRDTLQFAKCQWHVTLIQSVIVLAGRLFLDFRMFIFMHFAYDDGRLENGIRQGIRSVGIDISGSAGSVVLFVGLMCAVYLFFHAKGGKKEQILIEYFIVMAALLFMGRLGLYFGLAGLAAVCWICMIRKDACFRIIFLLAIFSCAAITVYVFLSEDSGNVQSWFHWIMELTRLFDKQGTLAAIRGQNIPPLTIETLFGTGMNYGVTPSGLVLNHDSGYVRMYTAIGLVGCVYYYSMIYGYYLAGIYKIKDRTGRRIYFCFLAAVVIFELKEPFLAKTPLTIILSCMILLGLKEEQRKKPVSERK